MANGNDKPIYQPWNETEFQGNIYVRGMNSLEKWMYRTLLQEAFFCPTRPYLPDDDDLLWVLAGCENKEQWTKNNSKIRARFEKVKINGQKLLSQNHLVEDWENYLERVETNRLRAQKGGLARSSLQSASSTLQASEVKLREVKISKDNKALSKLQKTETKIAAMCKEFLGRVEKIKDFRKLLKERVTEFNEETVLDNFQQWLQLHNNYSGLYPVSAYLKQMSPNNISSVTVKEVLDLNPILNEIVDIAAGEVAFNSGQQLALARLVTEFGGPTVVVAFRDYFAGLDEFSVKFAAKDFLEKANQLIRFQIRTKLNAETQEAMREQQKLEIRAEADEAIRKMEERDRESEESLKWLREQGLLPDIPVVSITADSSNSTGEIGSTHEGTV